MIGEKKWLAQASGTDLNLTVYFADPHALGSAVPTKTPTALFANICPRF